MNFYTKTKVINGKTYKAQFNGLSAALKAIDDSYVKDSKNTSLLKISEYIFANVIVEPAGLTVDDFETMEELNDVVAFGTEVMNGTFRDEQDEKPAAAAGK